MSVAEHFMHLLDQLDAQTAGITTRRTDVDVLGGRVLLGMDAASTRHVLIPLADHEQVVEDDTSAAVQIVEKTLTASGTGSTRYLDLQSPRPELAHVFESLVVDILNRLRAARDGSVAAVHSVIDGWRALLKVAVAEFGRQSAIGLIGELEIFKALSDVDAGAAVDSWMASRAPHDYVGSSGFLEVKSTASVDGDSVTVHNLDQLDPGEHNSMLLAVVHLQADPDGPDIDDRIRALASRGITPAHLSDQLLSHGYVFESIPHSGHRYTTRSIRLWEVTARGAGLRPSAIAPHALQGVSHVSYDIAVDVLGTPIVEDDVQMILGAWLHG